MSYDRMREEAEAIERVLRRVKDVAAKLDEIDRLL